MKSLSEQLVADFMSEHRRSGVYLRDHVTRLAELATSENEQVAEPATRAFFVSLVERLADSFTPDAVSLYNRAFAQLIYVCRRDPRAKSLDRELAELALVSEEDLIARAEKLRHVSPVIASRDWAASLRRIIVLSRVTLGADVAITSVILQRMKHDFPGAEILLLGGSKAAELFGGDERVRFNETSYRRTGATIERLLAWLGLLECVRELTRGLKRSEYLIVDPDTRLTQLGLLPIAPALEPSDPRPWSASREHVATARECREYVFFPSREYGADTSQSLGELTSAWLDEVFGESATTYPGLSLSRNDMETARNLLRQVRRNTPIVAINFGVGENQLKRVGGDFEASLISSLIQEGAAILLDKGTGKDEISRADAVIAETCRMERDGHPVRAIEIDESSLKGAKSSECFDADILVWNGRIGMLAALIGESDLYIGYDSAGQHIAAALGVSCIDVFAGFPSKRFVDRWRPTGKAETRVLAVDPTKGIAKTGELVANVLSHSRKMLKLPELKIES